MLLCKLLAKKRKQKDAFLCNVLRSYILANLLCTYIRKQKYAFLCNVLRSYILANLLCTFSPQKKKSLLLPRSRTDIRNRNWIFDPFHNKCLKAELHDGSFGKAFLCHFSHICFQFNFAIRVLPTCCIIFFLDFFLKPWTFCRFFATGVGGGTSKVGLFQHNRFSCTYIVLCKFLLRHSHSTFCASPFFSSPLSRPKMVFVTLIFNAWTQRYVIVLSKRRFWYFPNLWPQFCAPHQSAPCLQKGGRRASTTLCTFVSLIEPRGFFFFFHRIEKIIERFFVARLSVWRSGAASKVGCTETWRNGASVFITGNPKKRGGNNYPLVWSPNLTLPIICSRREDGKINFSIRAYFKSQ